MPRILIPGLTQGIPVNVTVVVAGFGYSQGGDFRLMRRFLLKIWRPKIGSPSLGVVHSFSLFGKTAQASVALPYAWGDVTATIGGEPQSTSRSGLGDMRLRLSCLLLASPAITPAEMATAPRKTILGTSLSITAPTGQNFPDKLINIGTSRWAFKPEIAISQPIGRRWLLDFYSGIWFFTKNDTFYPGTSVRIARIRLGHFRAISVTIFNLLCG